MASANIQGQNLLSRFQRSNNSDDNGNDTDDTDDSGGDKLPTVPVLQDVAAAAARREMVANHQRLLSRAAVGGRGISVRVPGEARRSDGVVVAAPSRLHRTGVAVDVAPPQRPAPANVVAGRRVAGERRRTPNYTDEEIKDLLQLIQDHLPISKSDWTEVVESLTAMGHVGRTVESVKRKFQELHRKKAPTGDPSCPPNVLWAKRIHRMIGDRADVGNGDEEYELESNQFGSSGEENQIEYAPEEGANNVDVVADVVVAVPRNLATRNSAAPPRRTNTFAETLDAQWLMEQRQRQADRDDERRRWEREMQERRELERMRREDDDRRQRIMNEMLTTALTSIATAFSGRTNNNNN